MPIAPDLVRVALRGAFLAAAGGSVVEEFVFGFHLQRHSPIPGDFDWQENVQAVADGVAERWDTAFALIGGRFAPTTRFDEVRAYHLDAATGNTLHLAQASLGALVGSGDVSLPTETTVCVSLYAYDTGAFNPAGGKARGRFYLPALNRAQIDVGGLLSVAAQTALANALDAFFEEVQGMDAPDGVAADAHWDVVISSSVDATARQVQRLRVGRVLDVQRRRRGDLDEQYVDRDLANH